ncbi:lactoylglutathione lyase [Leucobacter exalbidus]|uniref:Lactoylglutathione lyase n=1 Tax=Leucobacter exalbidus TaxID=662960 RepID=A0A940PY14_9MICO|nr:VOC family protein [Leucobacter exalbidus]MBP1327459.1 lactoylglutathione lyase [Leucobacter exalbidus]
MIDQFGKVMIYVADPQRVAAFWEQTVGFVRVTTQELEGRVLSVELAPAAGHAASLVLFERATVAQMSPELNLGTPSILFGSHDAAGMRSRLEAAGVTVGELAHHGGRTTFNFADPEGNYFAVEQL